MTFTIRQFQYSEIELVVNLWRECKLVVPHNNPYEDIDIKMQFQPDLFFVAIQDEELIGSIMIGYEGHRGWVNYLAVSPKLQRKGIGKALMEFAEIRLLEIGCPKLNLQVRSTNSDVINFYEKIGYKNDSVISFGKRLIPTRKD